jgi:hypothetical protein
VSGFDLVKLECGPETIGALSSHLEGYGPVDGEPQWLVSAAWLCAADADYLATSSTEVLSDGYIARPLAIDRVDEFLRKMRSELPDIAARLVARTSDVQLPEAARPEPPAALQRSRGPPRSTTVLIRLAQCRSIVHRVACGLLFEFDGSPSLLVGTDPSTPAMVLSEDSKLIERYVAECEHLGAAEYIDRYAG